MEHVAKLDEPRIDDTLTRSGGKWVVATAVVDTSGHGVVTWRRAARPDSS